MKQKKELNVAIGMRLRQARDFAGYTQEKLAELVDVSVQYISDLERGVVGVSVPTLMNLCRALNASSDFILFNDKGDDDEDVLMITRRIRRFSPMQRRAADKVLDALTEAFALEKENAPEAENITNLSDNMP